MCCENRLSYHIHTLFEAQTWSLTEDMKLENSGTQSDWKYGDSIWSIPEDEEEGYVRVKDTTEVLGVINGNKVTLQTKEIDNENQLWIRHSNWHQFILINKQSGLLLSGKQGTANPTIEG